MREAQIIVPFQVFAYEELSVEDRELVDMAKAMTATSYSPYSRFQVGAALRLADGQVFKGSNQENAAFPSGLCAERTAFFAASANAPEVPPVTLAIAARTGGHFLENLVAPCGACRQSLLEAETRFNQPIRVLLYGTSSTYVIQSIRDLLPLTFDGSELP